MDLGFNDFPTALTDDELGSVRQLPNFENMLSDIADRYRKNGVDRVGQPIAIPANGNKPDEGWPMILLLHGYGDSHLRYLDRAKLWADLGFVSVAVPGSVPLRSGAFRWDTETIETTQQDLQSIIQSEEFDELVNRDNIYLLGFSQAALHAILLAAEHPDLYHGVVAVSPGGSMSKKLAVPVLASPSWLRTNVQPELFLSGERMNL